MKSLLRLACVLAAIPLLAGCRKSGQSQQPAPPQVTVTRPSQQSVWDYIELTGSVAPFRTVDLVARVAGYLESAHFADGTWVEAGQLLFVIEPARYEQQLRLTQAQLLNAQSEYDRQLQLIKDNATSAATVERWLSQRDQAAAQVELAKLNLGYTRVTAPFSGRIGRRLVDPGNLVGAAGNTQLATLDQLVPIYVYFTLNERDALRIIEWLRKLGLEPTTGVGKSPVLVGLQNEEGYPHEGTLDFVDRGVSTSTGAIQLRAVFANKDKALFPGAFARVRLPLGEPHTALVVPNSAIGNDQEGDYVLVADPGDIVARRAVVKGQPTGNGCAIRSGLTPEDRVIVNGLMKARPGERVTPVKQTASAPAPSNPPR